MARYFIELSYRGTNYHGWQIQENAQSIQGLINSSLSILLKHPISTTGAGRTDTGVHAKKFIAHFDFLNEDLNKRSDLIYRLNKILPNDVRVSRITKVRSDAHARFNAISRTYEYLIVRKKDPFLLGLAWQYTGSLDMQLLQQATEQLLNYSDYTSFSKVGSDTKTSICKVFRADWTNMGDTLIFTIEADRFLRNMVRAIVGSLIDVGRGRITPDHFTKIVEARNRSLASTSAPAEGLYLIDIKYPEDIYLK